MDKALQAKYSDLIQEVGKHNSVADEDRIKKIVSICQELLASEQAPEPSVEAAIKECDLCLTWLKEQVQTKIEHGEPFPPEAYAYVPDKETPSEWKLRLWETVKDKVTRKQLGMAAAALSPGGFRGQKVIIPESDLAGVKRTIRAEYRRLNVSDDDIPKWVMEAQRRELVADYTPLTEATVDSKGKATLVVIRPGFNSSKQRFYPRDMLARDYKVFEGVKMYADHPSEHDEKQRPERSIRDWVATLSNVYPDSNGVILGEATIVEPWMQAKLATLRDKGMLQEMGISINAVGNASKAEIQGVKTNLIEQIVRARSVDFVTEAGAGGSVNVFESSSPETDIDLVDITQLKEHRPDLIKLVETDYESKNKQEVKNKMAIEQELATLKESNEATIKENAELKAKLTEADKAKAKAEAQATIKEAIAKATLPDVAKAKLTEQFKEAEKADGIDTAIKAEGDYLAKITESGKVRGLGDTNINAETGRKSLQESFKRMHPDWTEAQLKVAVEGR